MRRAYFRCTVRSEGVGRAEIRAGPKRENLSTRSYMLTYPHRAILGKPLLLLVEGEADLAATLSVGLKRVSEGFNLASALLRRTERIRLCRPSFWPLEE